MKKLLILTVMLLASAVWASAQYKTYYITEQVGEEYPCLYCFKIDWEAKKFFLESDSERENDGRIKNYKENGNKRTFEVWSSAESDVNEKVYTMTFITDGDGKYTAIQTLASGYKLEFKLSDVEPVDESAGPGGALQSKINAKKEAAKEAIGKGVNKALDALKNKKKDKK